MRETVEIIRCKDCIYSSHIDDSGHIECHLCENGDIWEAYDFCSYGVEKDV